MNPDLEFFLEDAFRDVTPTCSQIGRVVVEPDYEITQAESDRNILRRELIELIREHEKDARALSEESNVELTISRKFPLLAKYVRTVTLHKDSVPGDWVEVTPPGNWI